MDKLVRLGNTALRSPVCRGAPTSIDDYLTLIRYSFDQVIHGQKNALRAMNYSDLVIVAGIPYSAKDKVEKIKNAVKERFAPKFFGIMFQAKATLDHEGISDGIVCHIGHGTTEIMAVIGGSIAHAQTVMCGVGDIASVIGFRYADDHIFEKNTPELAENRKILAAKISDALEKTVVDYPNLQVICAGGGAMIPKMASEIKNDIITHIRIAKDPVFSNALGMLKKAERCV